MATRHEDRDAMPPSTGKKKAAKQSVRRWGSWMLSGGRLLGGSELSELRVKLGSC